RRRRRPPRRSWPLQLGPVAERDELGDQRDRDLGRRLRGDVETDRRVQALPPLRRRDPARDEAAAKASDLALAADEANVVDRLDARQASGDEALVDRVIAGEDEEVLASTE